MKLDTLDGYQIAAPRANLNTTAYQSSDEYERLSNAKQEQRERILNFILEHSRENIKFLGLPGKYWMFERYLLVTNPEAKITGIEKNPLIYQKAKILMPGNKKVIDKSKYITPSIKIDIHVNPSGIYMLGSIKDITDQKTHKLLCAESGTYTYRFTKVNAVWYDFTTSFNEDSFTAIHNIKNVISRKKGAIACFTLMYGRDLYFNGKGEDARIEIIKTAIPEFEPLKIWRYKGFNDTNMINICGLIMPKK